MGWKKHFTVYQKKPEYFGDTMSNSKSSRFQSWLPEVYSGMPNRVERYIQYDQMDMDAEINMALDTVAEFCTQIDEETASPFKINYKDKPTDSEARIINELLKQWCNINDWDRRMFKTFRNVLKYGDQPFIRDPETWELLFLNPQDVLGVVINESKGKYPEQYIIKNLDLNLRNKTATTPIAVNRTTGGVSPATFTTLGGRASNTTNALLGNTGANSFEEFNVDSENIVHVAMSEGMDNNWPFGNSILDPIFKTYKQKELLEDAIIIYRVQRAPERRVFYIDTGDMPPHKAASFLEKVKMEVHQKRIPNKSGGTTNIMDAQYNPMCLTLDTKIPLLDGRILQLSDLISEYQSGKENWAYSCDPNTGKIVPGVITWAGITRKNTDVIRLTFDNGKTLTVTPDHKIPVFGKGFVEAQYLTKNDSLISFETRLQKIPSLKNDTTYTQVYDHEEKEWKFVHRIVATYFRERNKHQEFTYIIDGIKNVIHHKDFNRYNNDPRNLQWMNKKDHFKFHGDSNFWNNISKEEADIVKNKISKTLKERWNNLDVKAREKEIIKIIDAQKKAVNLRLNDSFYKKNYKQKMSKKRKEFLEQNPDFIKNVWHKNIKTYNENYPNQKNIYSFRMLQIIADTVKMYNSNKKETIKLLSNNIEFLDEIKKCNPKQDKQNCKILYDNVTIESFERTLFYFGYKGWKDFKNKLSVFNHRIINVEYLEEKVDTGTITIDGKEIWHNYHTFATDSGIFVKNSILEDFFFAQGCLVLDTKLPLLDGRTLTLQEIINEHQSGKQNWVYGLSNVTHELEPAKIKWAGITRRDAKVLEVRLDNGESVIATPDHKFILRDGTEVEAQNLKSGDSLMPLKSLNYITILEIIELDYTIDTGDITIESESGSHWFGLGAGIYVHNSDGRGSKVEVLPGGHCLSLDTKIKLLDGRDLELSEIINEFNIGKQNWVYSCDPNTGKIVSGPITWAGITRKNAEVVRVALDNGESVIATPDHKFLLRSGEYIEAIKLKSGDSLMPHYEKINEFIDILYNHKVVSVEILDYRIDTGDITVDGNEIYHNYHNFSISAGIFISNSLGEIEDLKFFTDKMMRGLRIPSSYMPMSHDDAGGVFNDGRVGQAFIQEFRFNKYCMRLQNIIQPTFDREFKRFMKIRGYNIDSSLFDLRFMEPQSFSDYREIELDNARASLFNQLEGSKVFSRRFLLKRYLGLNESEILENEQMYMEENPRGKKPKIDSNAFSSDLGLSDVGIRDTDIDFGDTDLTTPETTIPEPEPTGGSPLGGEPAPEIQGGT